MHQYVLLPGTLWLPWRVAIALASPEIAALETRSAYRSPSLI